MGGQLATLCYHRILPEEARAGAGRPYFVRGTAVSDRNFAAQMKSLVENFDVLSEAEVLAWLNGVREIRRRSCWITFDDGYRDVIERAAPILAAYGLPATVFVTTGVIDDRNRWLPADHWYSTLARSTRRRGLLQFDDGPGWEFDVDRDFDRFVDGPERRRFLNGSSEEQAVMRRRLAEALRADESPRPDLYLDRGDLGRLAGSGWSIGGHGYSHAILTGLDEAALSRELEIPRKFLDDLGLSPRVFAYPDGAASSAVANAARQSGWAAGVTLGERWTTAIEQRLRLPRFLPTDGGSWVEENLLL